MKTTKKWLAMILAAVMMLCMALPAAAEETAATETPAEAENTYTSSDGVLSIELPNESWKEIMDPAHWIVLSDGANMITIDHFSNGEKLPETAIAPATDVTPTEAAASIEDSSQTASPTSNPTKAPAAGGTATPTARPTATPRSRPTAASSGEDIELPEIEIPVKRSLRRRPPRRSRKAPAMASGSPLTMRAISSCRRFPCRKRRCVRYAHEKTAVCRLGRLDIAFAPGILKGRAEYG